MDDEIRTHKTEVCFTGTYLLHLCKNYPKIRLFIMHIRQHVSTTESVSIGLYLVTFTVEGEVISL